MDTISLKAYAKINLALDVLRKRADGYHDVRMVMQTIRLYDRITFTKLNSEDITLQTNLHFLPTNENNLVYSAIKLFQQKTGTHFGIHVQLEKKIPVSAGMAGGSTDAAATLYGLNQLFHTGLSMTELMEIGVSLGADVPYCLMRGTALSEGIGEVLTPLTPAPPLYCLIVKPPISVSTKFIYEHLKLTEHSIHPNIDAMLSSLNAQDTLGICTNLGNILESVTVEQYPQIKDIKTKLLSLGAQGALMSGSGPTVFGLFTDKKTAEKAFYHFKVGPNGRQTYLTSLIQPTSFY